MIGKKIEKLRIRKEISQNDLAKELQVNVQDVVRWENEEIEPTLTILQRIAAFFDVTTDFLLNDDFMEKQVEKEHVRYDTVKPVLAVCEVCNTPIYEGSKIVRLNEFNVTKVICSDCNKIKEENEYKRKVEYLRSRRKKSYWFGGIVAGLFIAINIISAINNNDKSSIYIGIILGILAFTFISCCLLKNNFIGGMALDIFNWGFVKLPGLIFTLDLDGILWFLTVKLILWILNLLLAIFCGALAIIIGSVLSIFVYPFAIVKSYKHPEIVEI